MIAVIFEVQPHDAERATYFSIAAALRPELEKIPGFISIERFESITTPGKVLSLSFWKDEESVRQWRNMEQHRMAQQKGREQVFRDYRLRVADVLRDYGMISREEAPADSRAAHE
jgi:heme-degrading monooxygenase HmoA